MAIINNPSLWLDTFPWPKKTDHKYTRGHLVVVGGTDMTGAARLVVQASRRIGAGITTLLCPKEAKEIYQTTLLGTLIHSYKTMDEFRDFVEKENVNALVVGPGLSPTNETKILVELCLRTRKPLVIDAGGLSCYQDRPQDLFDLLHDECVLLPHEGEFKRLFSLGYDHVLSAFDAAKVCSGTLLLKGSESVIASSTFSSHNQCIINRNAPATLATAGTGDVLAGMVGGLLVQGMSPFLAVAASAWIQGKAARLFGPGLLAEDLIEDMPMVLKEIKQMGSFA